MRRIAKIMGGQATLLCLILGSACVLQRPSDPEPPIQTDQAVYPLEIFFFPSGGKGDIVVAEITASYTNSMSDTVYLEGCTRGTPRFAVERLENGNWAPMSYGQQSCWAMFTSLRVAPRETVVDSLWIKLPIFEASREEVRALFPTMVGPHRVVYQIYRDFNPTDEEFFREADLLPKTARISNTFEFQLQR